MKKDSNSLIKSVCSFIVDKRNIFFLIFFIVLIFSAVSAKWVKVENSLSFYLPKTTETKKGLDLMDEEFITYGSCKVMVTNVSYSQAEDIRNDLKNIHGVYTVDFDDTDEYYKDGAALFKVNFEYDEDDDECLSVLEVVKEKMAAYDSYIDCDLGDPKAAQLAEEMKVITVLVAIVVLTVLLITTQAYAEIPVLVLTFVSAALIQKGTNFVFGTISYVSNSVTVVLQLALSVDYAVILLDRYKEERAMMNARNATIVALSKAIPEICGSSLTTIGGLIAMTFMQYNLGPDLGICLIKSILISLMSVFVLMPGLIMLFADLMEKTKHRNFVPKIPFVGRFAYATRFFVAPLFLVVIIIAMRVSNGCPYVFGYTRIIPPIKSQTQQIMDFQGEIFGKDNVVALIVPGNDHETERKILDELEEYKEIDHTKGLANTEAKNGYMITDKLSPREFSELMGIEYKMAELIYAAYAIDDEDYKKAINGLSGYKVSLLDMLDFVKEEVDGEYISLDKDLKDKLDDTHKKVTYGKNQLMSEDYSRMLIYLALPEESDETFAFVDTIRSIGEKYYGDGKVLVCGESVSQYDLKKTFATDNVVVNVVSVLAVLVVLLFTFGSTGMPILLIAVIQGSIWINFSFPAIKNQDIFFIGYLIVSSIQMGANIDYAIVIASRYTELRQKMGRRKAIIDTMNLSFPTIITSGTMLATAGCLIGSLTSDGAIYCIGQNLGRGTIISIFITMLVLPQILLVGDLIIEKTMFIFNVQSPVSEGSGAVRVDGIVRGTINGTVIGIMHAYVKGDVSVRVDNGSVLNLTNDDIKVLEENIGKVPDEEKTDEETKSSVITFVKDDSAGMEDVKKPKEDKGDSNEQEKEDKEGEENV